MVWLHCISRLLTVKFSLIGLHDFMLDILVLFFSNQKGAVVVMKSLDLQLPVQSVAITTNVVSSNPAQTRCVRYRIM